MYFKALSVLLFISLNAFAQELTPLQQVNFLEMHLFNKQFDVAEKITLELLKKDSSNKTLNYYCALSRLGKSSIKESIPNFYNAFEIPEKPDTSISSIVYLGNTHSFEENKKSESLEFFNNTGFIFDFKIPYTNICISENSKSLVFIDATASLNKIFYSKNENQKWSKPILISEQIGSDGTYFPSCISNDNKRIYFTHYDGFESDIYVSFYDGNNWTTVKKLNSFINSKKSDNRAYENEMGTVLYFSSNKRGGLGGMDIYFSNKINNDWGKAVNCGTRINTFLNEDYPCVINNGKNILYSSQGIKKGVDGYDLYICSMLSDNQWTEPINLESPFNSSEDDYTYTGLTLPTRFFFALEHELHRKKNGKALNVLLNVKNGNNLIDGLITVIDLSNKFPHKKQPANSDGNFNFQLYTGIYKLIIDFKDYKSLNKNIIVPVVLINDTLKISTVLIHK